jgi:hypothetical protein
MWRSACRRRICRPRLWRTGQHRRSQQLRPVCARPAERWDSDRFRRCPGQRSYCDREKRNRNRVRAANGDLYAGNAIAATSCALTRLDRTSRGF